MTCKAKLSKTEQPWKTLTKSWNFSKNLRFFLQNVLNHPWNNLEIFRKHPEKLLRRPWKFFETPLYIHETSLKWLRITLEISLHWKNKIDKILLRRSEKYKLDFYTKNENLCEQANQRKLKLKVNSVMWNIFIFSDNSVSMISCVSWSFKQE